MIKTDKSNRRLCTQFQIIGYAYKLQWHGPSNAISKRNKSQLRKGHHQIQSTRDNDIEAWYGGALALGKAH